MSISNYFCLTIQLYYSRLTFLIKIMSPMYRITFFSHHFRSLLQPLGFLIFTLRIDFRLYSDTHSAVWKTDIWKYIPEITATVRPQLAFTRSPSISVTLLLQAAIRSLEWESLSAHSSKCDDWFGWGTHGSWQIHSGLSARVFAWHDAPKRSAACEITFIQPSHAWLGYFGWKKKAASK